MTTENKEFSRGEFQGIVITKLDILDRHITANNGDIKDVVATVHTLVTEVEIIKRSVPRKKLVNVSAIGLAVTIASGIAWGLYNIGTRLLAGN